MAGLALPGMPPGLRHPDAAGPYRDGRTISRESAVGVIHDLARPLAHTVATIPTRGRRVLPAQPREQPLCSRRLDDEPRLQDTLQVINRIPSRWSGNCARYPARRWPVGSPAMAVMRWPACGRTTGVDRLRRPDAGGSEAHPHEQAGGQYNVWNKINRSEEPVIELAVRSQSGNGFLSRMGTDPGNDP